MELTSTLEHAKSWILTFLSTFAVDFIAGLLVGLGALVESGDLTSASIMALATATLRSAMKLLLETQAESLKSLKDKIKQSQ
jgi:urea transporter